MEVKKGPALVFILAMMILITNTSICRAASAAPPVMKKSSNSSGGGCEGRLEACLIGDMDLDEELFIMDSDISRRMMVGFGTVTEGSKTATSPSVPCGRGKPYDDCLPPKNNRPQHNEHCGIYKRGRC